MYNNNSKSDPSLSGVKFPFDIKSNFFNCKCNHICNNEPTLNKISEHVVKCYICLTSIELSPNIEIPGDLKNNPDRFKILEEVYKVEKNEELSVITSATTKSLLDMIKINHISIGTELLNTLNNIKGKIIEKEYDKYVIEYWVEGLFTEIPGTLTEKIIEKVNLTQLNKLIEKGIIKKL